MIRRGLPGGSFKPLTEESIDRVHQTVMQIIEEVGFEVNSEIALELFKGAGAWVDKGKHLVRLPQKKTMELIEMAPSDVRLCGQDEKHDILLGGNHVYTGTGGTALYIYHPDTGQKQLASLDDLKRIAGLVDKLDNIHLFMQFLPNCFVILNFTQSHTYCTRNVLSTKVKLRVSHSKQLSYVSRN